MGLIFRAEVELGDWGPALWVRGFGYKGSSVRLCWARGELAVNSRDSLHFLGVSVPDWFRGLGFRVAAPICFLSGRGGSKFRGQG